MNINEEVVITRAEYVTLLKAQLELQRTKHEAEVEEIYMLLRDLIVALGMRGEGNMPGAYNCTVLLRRILKHVRTNSRSTLDTDWTQKRSRPHEP